MYMLMGDSGTVVIEGTGTVTGEDVSYTGSVTKNPVEGGGEINDHATNDPIKFSFSGIVATDEGRATMIAMQRNKDLLTYRGIEALDNLVMTSLAISRAANNLGGYSFKATLQRVEIASAAFVPVTGPTMTQMDAGKSNTSGSSKSNVKASSQGLKTTSSTDYMDYTASFYGPVSDGPNQPSNPGSAGYRSGN